MKKTTLILFLFIGIIFGYSQNYSSKKLEKEVAKLGKKVIDTAYFDDKNGKELEKPKLEFWVNDKVTGNIFSTDPNFSDNEMYSTFQKILRKGNLSDFKKMCENANPSIRVYGFWALVKNREYGIAEIIMQLEENKNADVYWNSAGCVVEPIRTFDIMKELIERIKKYGS